MTFFYIEWREQHIDGWIDIIPAEWLANASERRDAHWFYKSGENTIKQAFCMIKSDGKKMVLDYSGAEDKKLNEQNGAAIGVLCVELTDNHVEVSKVWWAENRKAKFVICNTLTCFSDIEVALPDFVTMEGGLQLVTHLIRERDPSLAKRKILSVGTEPLCCEACGFDFEKQYGDLGKRFCEVHHTKPLAVTGRTKASLKDVAIVCSNCHRMIHRTNPIENIELFKKRLQVICCAPREAGKNVRKFSK